MMRGEGENPWSWLWFGGGMWRKKRERMERKMRELKLGSIGECWF